MESRVVTRREFLKTGTSAALAGAMFLNTPGELFAESDTKSRVVLIRDKAALTDQNEPRADVMQSMLDEAVTTLLDETDVEKAWKSLFEPKDVVGIKTNVWAPLHTPAVLEEAIKKRVAGTGVEENNIGVRDRGTHSDPLFTSATALVNVRPLRTHHWSGVGSLIKNYITFVAEPWTYHGDSCADLASIWKLPAVAGKTRLNILVLLTPLFHGIGPHHFNAQYVWVYNGLLVGFDPVAVDSVGVRILQAKRRAYFEEERPLNPPAKHVFYGDTRHHLGTADPEKIELVKLGWKENILI